MPQKYTKGLNPAPGYAKNTAAAARLTAEKAANRTAKLKAAAKAAKARALAEAE